MQSYRFPFEKLLAWQDSRKFVKKVYQLTAKFPAAEKFGLVSQINRAVVSVASNLAEGSSRTSLKDQAHFSQLAFSSLMEVACQLTLATDLGYMNDDELKKYGVFLSELSNKINALRNSQLKRAKGS